MRERLFLLYCQEEIFRQVFGGFRLAVVKPPAHSFDEGCADMIDPEITWQGGGLFVLKKMQLLADKSLEIVLEVAQKQLVVLT